MEKFIEVYDNCIPTVMKDSIENYIFCKDATSSCFPLFYSDNLTSLDRPSKPGVFNSLLYKNQDKYNYTPHTSFLLQILYTFCYTQKIFVYDILTARVFIDFPSPSPQLDLPPHIDTPFPHWVCLYYINDSEGDTVLFKDDKKTEIKRVSPKKGRIVFFDGSIYHCGSNNSNTSRGVVNFNFIGEKL